MSDGSARVPEQPASASRPLSPLRTIVARVPSPDHPSVLMDKLDCGHLLTHVGDANRQTRRRCFRCRQEAEQNG